MPGPPCRRSDSRYSQTAPEFRSAGAIRSDLSAQRATIFRPRGGDFRGWKCVFSHNYETDMPTVFVLRIMLAPSSPAPDNRGGIQVRAQFIVLHRSADMVQTRRHHQSAIVCITSPISASAWCREALPRRSAAEFILQTTILLLYRQCLSEEVRHPCDRRGAVRTAPASIRISRRATVPTDLAALAGARLLPPQMPVFLEYVY